MLLIIFESIKELGAFPFAPNSLELSIISSPFNLGGGLLPVVIMFPFVFDESIFLDLLLPLFFAPSANNLIWEYKILYPLIQKNKAPAILPNIKQIYIILG